MKRMLICVALVACAVLLLTTALHSQNGSDVDTDALIQRILDVYFEQRNSLSTVTFDVVYAEGEIIRCCVAHLDICCGPCKDKQRYE